MAKKKNRSQQIPKTNPDNELDQQEANTSIRHDDQQVNPATGEPVGEVTTTPTPGEETPPEDPATLEKPVKKAIPKVNTPSDEKAKKAKNESVNVGHPDDNPPVDMDADHQNQFNPEQAVNWAMTQKDPKVAINRLKHQRRLLSVTETLALLKERGIE